VPTVGVTHNIELGGRYYMLRPGSYLKRAAPMFGPRFSTGDPDFNNLSGWQHWAQRCFVGGIDAELFADDAMYDDGAGVDTTTHEQVTLSRDLARGAGSNWTVGGTSLPRKFFVWNAALWSVTIPATGTAGVLWKYDPSTDGWTSIATVTDNCVRGVAVFDGKVFFAGRKLDNSAAKLSYGTTSALTAFTTVTLPAGITSGAATAVRTFQQKLYVSFSSQVWRLKDDLTWDGNTVFYKASAASDSNYMVAMEPHLGFLYMLSQNGHVHRTDGNSTFDIWNWDGQTTGVAMRSFDGRLFIATYEYTNTADVGFAVLYQMSGSAVTQLKRWGKGTEANTIGNLLVFDRKMFYGAGNLLGARRGFGIAAYDPIEDAHSIIAANGDTVTYAPGSAPYVAYLVDDVFAFGGYLFASVRGHGLFKTPYQPRDYSLGLRTYDISVAGGAPGAQNGGWFTTSTYDAGTPGVLKLWRKIVVDYYLPTSATSITVEYSTDNGTSWTLLNTISQANGANLATRERKDLFLNSVQAVSLKLRFTLRSTTTSKTPTFFGFVVSYLPIPEPNWMWSFTIVMSEKQVLVDGTEEGNDTEEEMSFLRNLFRTKQMVHFTDIDDSVWAAAGQPGVFIYDIEFRIPDPSSQPLEGDIAVTLLEAVETY
jgi:hypothetical protein